MEDQNNEFLEKVVAINAVNIDEHFRSVPAELAYYNARFADASEAYLTAKMMVERNRAKSYKDAVYRLEGSGKKSTVAAIEAELQLDLEYQCAREAYVHAEAEKVRAKGLVEVVHAKKDMLVSLGAHIRSEMSDPVIRREVAEQKEIKSQGLY